MTESESRSGETTGAQAARSGEMSGTQKARRSGRLTLAIPIQIIGNDEEGRVFSEETHTVVVSLHGAGIVSRHRLMAEQELILRAMASEREAEARVVGEIASQGEMYTYGVAFVEEGLDFWEMEFPPPPAWRPEVLALECGGCKDVVELTNGDFEYDICAIHGGLARFCKECGLLTVWRHSQEAAPRAARGARTTELAEAPVAVAEGEETREEFVALADAMEGTERRARMRAKVSFFACVRTEEFGEDIVACIDMSRGGVSFRSRNLYQKGMGLRIAVPFSPEEKEAAAIFVRGRIANVREVEGEGMRRCGVEFVRE
jgi:hypothetical protein